MIGPSRLWHAAKARALMAACGGLVEAAGACRLGTSQLSRAQDPLDVGETYLPADVIAVLEAYCGRPIYSAALAELVAASAAVPAGDVLQEACDVVECASALMARARSAASDGQLSPREGADLLKASSELRAELEQIEALAAAAGADRRTEP